MIRQMLVAGALLAASAAVAQTSPSTSQATASGTTAGATVEDRAGQNTPSEMVAQSIANKNTDVRGDATNGSTSAEVRAAPATSAAQPIKPCTGKEKRGARCKPFEKATPAQTPAPEGS